MSLSNAPKPTIGSRNPDVRKIGNGFQVFLGWNDQLDDSNADDSNTWVWAAKGATAKRIITRTHSNGAAILPTKKHLHQFWVAKLKPSESCSKLGEVFL